MQEHYDFSVAVDKLVNELLRADIDIIQSAGN